MPAFRRLSATVAAATGSPLFWRRFHLGFMLLWLLLIVPSWLWWSESVLWVILISIDANIVGHWGAFQAARAEQATADRNK